ncbi:MAG: hypothetical protein AVDCRST_MAG01-01-3800, partial [uncultured Rubrobacteraceae bacterium]
VRPRRPRLFGLPVRPRGGGSRRRCGPRPPLRRGRARRPAHLPRPLEQRLHGRSDLSSRRPTPPPRGRQGPPRRVRRPRPPGRPERLQKSHARRSRRPPRLGPAPAREL